MSVLNSVFIENIALIKSLNIDFPEGFITLTGETGAGKSIILDSLGLLVSQRITKELVREGEAACRVTAVFSDLSENLCRDIKDLISMDIEDGCVILSRSLSLSGKSVCKINGRTVPFFAVKSIASRLIAIHGQHDSQALLDSKSHIRYLDSAAGAALSGLKEDFLISYKKFKDISSRLEKLIQSSETRKAKLEILEYQIKDISRANLKPGEEEKLEQRRSELMNAERISQALKTALIALSGSEKQRGAADLLMIASDRLSAIKEFKKFSLIAQRIEELSYELGAIKEELLAYIPPDDENPAELLDKIGSRLDTIYRLKQKYGSSIEGILDFLEKIKAEYGDSQFDDENIKSLTLEKEKAFEECRKKAELITEERKKTALALEKSVTEKLQFLDMKNTGFKIVISPLEDEENPFNSNGADRVEFFINTNIGESYKPLSLIASGGELSRTMLALQCVMSSAEEAGMLIFDEIDTGISGKTAQKIGICLKLLSECKQVVCVTHSAQVASLSDSHFKVSKSQKGDRTETTITLLSHDEKIEELARILGGINITETTKKNAVELIRDGVEQLKKLKNQGEDLENSQIDNTR